MGEKVTIPKWVCDELSELLSTDAGRRTVRLLQLAGLVASRNTAETSEPSDNKRSLTRIGPWMRQATADGVEFVREKSRPFGDDWSPVRVLARKSNSAVRIALVGESVATGFFYAPQLTPAKILQDILRSVSGGESFDLLDLSKVDLRVDETPDGLLGIVAGAVELDSDILVIFCGNNWYSPLSAENTVSEIQRLSLAFEEDGIVGLINVRREDLRKRYLGAFAELARIVAAKSTRVIIVVPEVNLRDWSRTCPVPWLSGDGLCQWHAVLTSGRAALEMQRFEVAESAARELIRLDRGTCSTSFGLLGDALLGLGDCAAASGAFIRQVETDGYQPVATPGAGSTVRGILREGAAAYGFEIVDLPAIFTEAVGGPPGSELFIDYCHLSLEGMRLAMTAVASTVLGVRKVDGCPQYLGWRELLPQVPALQCSAEKESIVGLLSALYRLHWERTLVGNERQVRDLLDRALGRHSSARYIAGAIARAHVAPAPSVGLSLAEQALVEPTLTGPDGVPALVGQGRRLRRVAIGASTIRLLVDALAVHDPEVFENFEHESSERDDATLPLELCSPYYDGDRDSLFHGWAPESTVSAGGSIRRAFASRTEFSFLVARPSRSVVVEIVARLPAQGHQSARILVELNNVIVAELLLGTRWSRTVAELPRAFLKQLNSLVFIWPLPEHDGDQALREISRRLEQGLPAEIYPLFGELYSIKLRLSTSTPMANAE